MKQKLLPILILAIPLLLWVAGCSDEDDSTSPAGPSLSADNCFGCHTSQEKLIATAIPDSGEAPEDPGEG
ncbi:MAG: hypothetical protein H6508_09540 [Calditrichaeota bacterium]|nr:hypothetical protein [Calditrichota bacterium]